MVDHPINIGVLQVSFFPSTPFPPVFSFYRLYAEELLPRFIKCNYFIFSIRLLQRKNLMAEQPLLTKCHINLLKWDFENY